MSNPRAIDVIGSMDSNSVFKTGGDVNDASMDQLRKHLLFSRMTGMLDNSNYKNMSDFERMYVYKLIGDNLNSTPVVKSDGTMEKETDMDGGPAVKLLRNYNEYRIDYHKQCEIDNTFVKSDAEVWNDWRQTVIGGQSDLAKDMFVPSYEGYSFPEKLKFDDSFTRFAFFPVIGTTCTTIWMAIVSSSEIEHARLGKDALWMDIPTSSGDGLVKVDISLIKGNKDAMGSIASSVLFLSEVIDALQDPASTTADVNVPYVGSNNSVSPDAHVPSARSSAPASTAPAMDPSAKTKPPVAQARAATNSPVRLNTTKMGKNGYAWYFACVPLNNKPQTSGEVDFIAGASMGVAAFAALAGMPINLYTGSLSIGDLKEQRVFMPPGLGSWFGPLGALVNTNAAIVEHPNLHHDSGDKTINILPAMRHNPSSGYDPLLFNPFDPKVLSHQKEASWYKGAGISGPVNLTEYLMADDLVYEVEGIASKVAVAIASGFSLVLPHSKELSQTRASINYNIILAATFRQNLLALKIDRLLKKTDPKILSQMVADMMATNSEFAKLVWKMATISMYAGTGVRAPTFAEVVIRSTTIIRRWLTMGKYWYDIIHMVNPVDGANNGKNMELVCSPKRILTLMRLDKSQSPKLIRNKFLLYPVSSVTELFSYSNCFGENPIYLMDGDFVKFMVRAANQMKQQEAAAKAQDMLFKRGVLKTRTGKDVIQKIDRNEIRKLKNHTRLQAKRMMGLTSENNATILPGDIGTMDMQQQLGARLLFDRHKGRNRKKARELENDAMYNAFLYNTFMANTSNKDGAGGTTVITNTNNRGFSVGQAEDVLDEDFDDEGNIDVDDDSDDDDDGLAKSRHRRKRGRSGSRTSSRSVSRGRSSSRASSVNSRSSRKSGRSVASSARSSRSNKSNKSNKSLRSNKSSMSGRSGRSSSMRSSRRGASSSRASSIASSMGRSSRASSTASGRGKTKLRAVDTKGFNRRGFNGMPMPMPSAVHVSVGLAQGKTGKGSKKTTGRGIVTGRKKPPAQKAATRKSAATTKRSSSKSKSRTRSDPKSNTKSKSKSKSPARRRDSSSKRDGYSRSSTDFDDQMRMINLASSLKLLDGNSISLNAPTYKSSGLKKPKASTDAPPPAPQVTPPRNNRNQEGSDDNDRVRTSADKQLFGPDFMNEEIPEHRAVDPETNMLLRSRDENKKQNKIDIALTMDAITLLTLIRQKEKQSITHDDNNEINSLMNTFSDWQKKLKTRGGTTTITKLLYDKHGNKYSDVAKTFFDKYVKVARNFNKGDDAHGMITKWRTDTMKIISNGNTAPLRDRPNGTGRKPQMSREIHDRLVNMPRQLNRWMDEVIAGTEDKESDKDFIQGIKREIGLVISDIDGFMKTGVSDADFKKFDGMVCALLDDKLTVLRDREYLRGYAKQMNTDDEAKRSVIKDINKEVVNKDSVILWHQNLKDIEEELAKERPYTESLSRESITREPDSPERDQILAIEDKPDASARRRSATVPNVDKAVPSYMQQTTSTSNKQKPQSKSVGHSSPARAMKANQLLKQANR